MWGVEHYFRKEESRTFSVLRGNGPINTGNHDSNDSSSETVKIPEGSWELEDEESLGKTDEDVCE